MPFRPFVNFVARQKLKVAARLLRDYPGLEGEDPVTLAAIARQAYNQSIREWPYLIFGCVALAVSFFLVTPLLVGILSNWFDIPGPFALMLPCAVGSFAMYRFRVARTQRITTRLIAATFPGLYCPCGYCLRGHADGECCPECGAGRNPAPPPT